MGTKVREPAAASAVTQKNCSAMKYILQKIFLAVFCGAFMLGGLVWSLRVFSGDGQVDSLMISVPFMLIPLVVLLTQWRQISRFQTMTYQWYCKTYPKHAQQGRLSCFACGGHRVHVRALLNRTFHREHFCPQCGKTLYYSPEQG